ncbi:MAG TPA: nitroreductase [Rhodospirillales bacterium]|nr:nitroreductase [Rhodospirillales bacterium]
MDALTALLGRHTTPPVKMGEPGPDEAALHRMLEAAAAAPDHGRLRPFRFLVVRGEGRTALGRLFAEALRAEVPGIPEAELEKQRSNPERVPLVLVAVLRLQPDHPKIPEHEQIAAAAAAVQNLLVAAHALGFASKWASGRPAASAGVCRGLGLAENERILGILYLGSERVPQPPGPRPRPEEIAEPWPSP